MSLNKVIDLCGIGNSLLDIQYLVDDDLIKQLNINKGEMRLVDSSEQKKVIEKINFPEENRASGGSAANTIIAFSQFGGKAAYNSKLGDDDYGKFYAKEFEELGIVLNYSKSKTEPTGTCLILISPDSERTMLTNLGASASFGIEDISEELIKSSKWLYLEGYKFSKKSSTDALFKAIEIAMANNTKISLTFSDAFITSNFRDSISECIKHCDLIFCNEAEALNFSQTDKIEESIKFLNDKIKNFAITKGSKGAVVKWKDKFYQIPSYPANPVDSTGAGDIFAAGFFYGIIKYNDPELAGKFGSLAGAKIVSQIGPRLKQEHSKIIDFFFG